MSIPHIAAGNRARLPWGSDHFGVRRAACGAFSCGCVPAYTDDAFREAIAAGLARAVEAALFFEWRSFGCSDASASPKLAAISSVELQLVLMRICGISKPGLDGLG